MEVLQELNEIGGTWNGDLPGRDEDRAHLAEQAASRISEALEIVEEINKL